jgi:predicted CxxxxCH...CXXCH cytochrome family protein
LVSCQICHAKDFTGGASANACSSCHGVSAPHPRKPWRSSGGSVFNHTDTDESNAAVCAQCHYPGSPNNPDKLHPLNPAPAGTQPGCYNATLCHANPVPHPVPFLKTDKDESGNGHMTVTSAAFASDCASCHAYVGVSPAATAPLCSTCHTLANPTVAGTDAGTCLSCHAGTAGLPNGPGGTAFPSIAGAHSKHMALPTTLSCDTCHAGSGTGTAQHYTNANARKTAPTGPASVALDATFNAKSGASSFAPTSLTCSNVSCHGGQATPAWQGGTLNSNAQCTACHGVTDVVAGVQFNDAFGRHNLGSHNALTPANGIACTTCHNMANGSAGALAHFKYLNTPAVDGTSTGAPADQMPSGTIAFNGAIVTGGIYTVTSATQGNGSCALTCHTHVHTAAVNTWTAAGVPHPVPFLAGQADTQGNGHLTVTSAAFAADCVTCHAYSVATSTQTAPLCNVCHTLANPTSAGTNAGTCLSCHAGTPGLPNGPGGTTFPSIAGAHLKHMGLATSLTCDTCHTGSGTGTTLHYANANARTGVPAAPGSVSMDPTFASKGSTSSTFTPASLTCSNVRCHGGQITPDWQVGTLNTSTQCTACHAVAASAAAITQYNDAFGRHSMGTHDATVAANSIACTTCHNMASGSSPAATNHFKYLNTAAVDGVSGTPSDQLTSGTISFDPIIVTAASPYTVTTAGTGQGNGGCALTCHTHIHTGPTVDTWQSTGAPHQVPFYSSSPVDTAGNGHMTVTLAQFTADCKTCHAYSGTSPLTNAPLCNVCHKLADPTQVATGAGTCLSCHSGSSFMTVGPTGSTYPNNASAHPKHMALATTLSCDSCHQGVGTLSQVHYDNGNYRTVTPAAPAAVAITAFRSENGGTQSFDPTAFTCSNISCHGGKLTPSWQSAGSINATLGTDCVKCHAINDGTLGTVQYNDAVGRHAWGTHKTAATADCSICHAMNNSSNGALKHFAELDTNPVDSAAKRASGTIHFTTSTAHPISGAMTYDVTTSPFVEGGGGCALTCHTTNHVPANNYWSMPKGTVPHNVPFYKGFLLSGVSHQSVTLAQFNTTCSSCHAYSGASPSSAPLCNVCHLLGDPVQPATGAGTCLSCHVNINGGTSFTTQGPIGGSAWPNLPRAHAKHTALSTFTRGAGKDIPGLVASDPDYPICASCHTGFLPGEGTLSKQTHYDNANTRSGTGATGTTPVKVALHATFNSKASNASATSSTNPTCSAVSCHGGITTPVWSGALPVVTSGSNCTSCHANRSTSTQYNDARGTHNSGEHPNVSCLICHDMNPATNPVSGVTNHYKYLDTTVAAVSPDQRSIDTIKPVIYNGTTITTGVVSGGTILATSSVSVGTANCALTCHTPGGNKTHGPGNDGSWNSTP